MLADALVVAGAIGLAGFLAWFFFGPKTARTAEVRGGVQEVKTFGARLQAFAMTGLALVLSGMVLALYTIAQVLRFQHSRIAELAQGAE